MNLAEEAFVHAHPVDPQTRVVMVHTAVRKRAVDPAAAETFALWWGLGRALGN